MLNDLCSPTPLVHVPTEREAVASLHLNLAERSRLQLRVQLNAQSLPQPCEELGVVECAAAVDVELVEDGVHLQQGAGSREQGAGSREQGAGYTFLGQCGWSVWQARVHGAGIREQ